MMFAPIITPGHARADSAASGARSGIFSNALAGPAGKRLPCSQFRTVSNGTPIRAAKASLRRPRPSPHPPRVCSGVLRRCGIILGGMAMDIGLGRRIDPARVNAALGQAVGVKRHANCAHSGTPPWHWPCWPKSNETRHPADCNARRVTV